MRTKHELQNVNFKIHVKQTTQIFGGGKRDRTADLLHAMQALSQLSYTPQTTLQNFPSKALEIQTQPD